MIVSKNLIAIIEGIAHNECRILGEFHYYKDPHKDHNAFPTFYCYANSMHCCILIQMKGNNKENVHSIL